jgi:2-polyprenyl-3-methyl-5-hydroxy-6-metoxy-1,4-benzoquinol methylase
MHSAMSSSVSSSVTSSGTTTSWKTRLYEGYVSSGQALRPDRQDTAPRPEQIFGPRAQHVRSVIARYLPPDRSARIVDLACGAGVYLYYLRAAGYTNVSGVDVSSEQIDLARRLGISGVRSRDLLAELGETDSGSVDAILMIDILEHLENDQLFKVLDEVCRVLKHDGVCVAHVPNAEGLYGMRARYSDLTHERAFAPKSARQLFLTIGFRDVQGFEDRPVVHGLKSLVRRILWTAGTMAPRLLLAAETAGHGFILSQNMIVIAHV